MRPKLILVGLLLVRAAVVGVVLALTGCFPVPHYEYFAPSVTGMVSKDGHPVAGAKLVLHADTTQATRVAYSDGAGRFVLDSLREYYHYVSFSGDPPHAFSVTITVDGKDYAAFQQPATHPPRMIHLDCDLTAPVDVGGQVSYCKWVP